MITDGWRPLVVADGGIDRRAYTFCVLDRLRLALRRRDVYVVGADRWGDPRRLLMRPDVWKSVGPQVLRTLALPPRAPSYIERLGAELDAAYFDAAEAVEKDPTMWIDEDGRRDQVHVASSSTAAPATFLAGEGPPTGPPPFTSSPGAGLCGAPEPLRTAWASTSRGLSCRCFSKSRHRRVTNLVVVTEPDVDIFARAVRSFELSFYRVG